MNKLLKPVIYIIVSFSALGCFSPRPHAIPDKTLTGESSSPYSGPQAKIAVNDFELKTSALDAETGLALKEYFINILNTTRRFSIVTPQDADLIISIGVIEFVPENSGGKAGFAGGGSSLSGFMGGLLGEDLNRANMQLSVRIVDKATSNIISSRDIQSQAQENVGKKTETPYDKVFKTGLSQYASAPMGNVIHDCLTEATRYIAQNIPVDYYKEQNGKKKTQGKT